MRKIDQTEAYSEAYRVKLKETYRYFQEAGFSFREHALNRVLGQKQSKGKFFFTKEDLLQVLCQPYNYEQSDGKLVRFYGGIGAISAQDTGEIVTIVIRSTPGKEWKAR